MALETASVTFYRIDACGLYKWTEHDEPFLGCVTDILDDLYKWSDGKELAQTATYKVQDGQDVLPSFLFDIKKSEDNFLLTIWNVAPTSEGAVASVDPNSSVGQASVTMNDLKKGTVAGFATYFWFVPSRNVFACVQFGHPVTGHKVLERYLKSFIDPHSKYIVIKPHPKKADIEVKRYASHEKDNKLSLHARFKSSIYRKPGNTEYILSNYARIDSVIRKTNLDLANGVVQQGWQHVVGLLKRGLNITPRIPTQSVNFLFEIPVGFSYQDLNLLIDDWDENNSNARAEWDDYGFKLKGEKDRTLWLSSSIARDKFDVDVSRDFPEIVNSEDLLNQLNLKSASLLSLLT